MKWTLLMPATRPSCAWATLWSASMGQTHRPSGVIVADNGPVSVTARMEWRFVVDALTHSRIPVTVLRRLPAPDVNAARMWHLMLTRAEGVVGLCDDDVLWEPQVARSLTTWLNRRPEVAFACTLQLTPNNEQDALAWTAPAFPSEHFGDEPDDRAYEVSRSSGHALFFDAGRYDGRLAEWPRPTDYDNELTRHLGTGLRVVEHGCRAWEMAHPENRAWRPNTP